MPTAKSYPSDTDSETDNASDLPFPEPLPRQSFLSPTFSPSTFLSQLHRHQTLSDLRTDLQTRSSLLSAELSTLVNDEYASFLSLGAALRGGESDVEAVHLGVLSFSKGVGGVRDGVRERRVLIEGLLREREGVVREIVRGKEILGVAEKVGDLELGLGVDASEDAEFLEVQDEEEGDYGGVGRLTRIVHLFVSTNAQITRLNEQKQPFLEKLLVRMVVVRKTVLLDLATALKLAKSAPGLEDRLLKIMGLYTLLDEKAEAVKVLKEQK